MPVLLVLPRFFLIYQHRTKQLVHLVYDVRRDDARFRARLGLPGSFDEQRKHYRERRELSSLQVEGAFADQALGELGFALSRP